MTYKFNTNQFLTVAEIDSQSRSDLFNTTSAELTLVWNKSDIMKIDVDSVHYEIVKNDIFLLNSFHRIESVDLKSARMLRFSKSFLDYSGHDEKIDSDGINPLGKDLGIISIDEKQLERLESAWAFLLDEINSADDLQKEIFPLLLKRILSFCKSCTSKKEYFNQNKYHSDIVSSFNILLENHFSEHHDVAFYANKLNKKPKTLSVLFSLLMGCPPKNFIHDRIMADARNQIKHTHKSIKEIAYDLGYEDIQTFSRFFKSKEGMSPLHYREMIKLTAS